jgi:hypothetical protein
MMDAGPAGGDGRRRGKKNRGRQGRRKRPKNRGHRPQPIDRFPAESPFGDDRSVLGGRMPKTSERRGPHQDNGPPDPFGLFCAYYLGITASDGYQKPQLEEVARRFGMSPKEVRDLLGEHGLDEESVRKVDFDLEGAQLDIRLAPEGISRTEVARDLWQDYLQAKADG